VNISGERGEEYHGDLIIIERWTWGPPDIEIIGGAHGEGRGREEINAERRKEKTFNRTIMQARAPASLAPYSSTRAPTILTPFYPPRSGALVLHGP
jgi:hypothetical protein